MLNTKSSEKSPDATHTPPAHNPEIDSDSHKKPLPPTQTEGDKPKATNKTPTSVQSQHIVEKPETEAPSTNVQDNHKAKPPKKPGSFSIEDDWQGVLDLTKKKNNSLYTVLRLAKPELNGDDLTLYFAFPFHQKKLDEPRYKSIVAEAVNEQTGTSVAITAIVDKDKVNKPSTVDTPAEPKNNANASLISSVQDIMGGGEVVNL